MARPRVFFAQVTDPTGHTETECVSVEVFGPAGEVYRFVLDDGSSWQVDGPEFRAALADVEERKVA